MRMKCGSAIVVSVLLAFTTIGGLAHAQSDCGLNSQWLDRCSNVGATAGGQGVELTGQSNSGSQTGQGSSSGGGSRADSADSTSSGSSPAEFGTAPANPVYRPLNPARFGTTDIRCVITVGGRCEVPFIGNAQTEDEDAVLDAGDSLTVVTISDIASFAPRAAVQFMQPDRWMVVGLPTNFYAQIDRHVVSGTLLGQPADVRFTPRAYSWSYGDGTTALSGTPGNTWQALGLAEFDPTATSHVYTVEGTYVIDLTVLYTAEYRWAGGAWTPIAGHVELPANPLVAEATSDAVTVLVDRDCTRAPVGPGC